MGKRLVEIVEQVRTRSKGLPSVNLARLNLKVGKPLSRFAATLDDDPATVAAAERALKEILSQGELS
ncbi:MAG TPA: hypothetical protein PKE31_04685 [Pseudomonadota bacterium]|jgi:hypothetical protein|nr:hypothetical protein [Pseudomonadota bacterium]